MVGTLGNAVIIKEGPRGMAAIGPQQGLGDAGVGAASGGGGTQDRPLPPGTGLSSARLGEQNVVRCRSLTLVVMTPS